MDDVLGSIKMDRFAILTGHSDFDRFFLVTVVLTVRVYRVYRACILTDSDRERVWTFIAVVASIPATNIRAVGVGADIPDLVG